MQEELKTHWFCKKVSEYRQSMFVLAISILKNETDAEDAIQNTLLLAYENLNKLRITEKFKPWLFRILTNECYKIAKKRTYYSDIDEIELEDKNDSFSDNKALIWQAVNSLELNYRTVIVLFYYEDMSIKEIAKTLEISQNNVKKRLSRARDKLKDCLIKEEIL